MPGGFTRRRYGPRAFNLPRDELGDAMVHIQQAIDGKPDGRKPFLVLHGAPGVGKSWLLEQIRHNLQGQGVRCAEIVQAQELFLAPEATLITLLRWCLQDPAATVAGATPPEIVQELSNRLDHILRDPGQPLALFFDDLDYWLRWLRDKSLPDESLHEQKQKNERLQRIYRQLWWALLRHTHLPGLVICTSQEPLPATGFSPAMIRKLWLIGLKDVEAKIDQLVDGILLEPAFQENPTAVDAEKLRELSKRYACGHPLVVDWLASKLAEDSQAFEDANLQQSLRELAGVIVDGRLDAFDIDGRVDASDEELLIDLSRNYPDGFAETDPILGAKGPGLARRLKQVGLVYLKPGTSTFQVLPPLACLYKKEGSNG